MPEYHKICENVKCGRKFIAKRKDKRYCSNACRVVAGRKKSDYEADLKRIFERMAITVLENPNYEFAGYFGENSFSVRALGEAVKKPYPKTVTTKRYVFKYQTGGAYTFKKRNKIESGSAGVQPEQAIRSDIRR